MDDLSQRASLPAKLSFTSKSVLQGLIAWQYMQKFLLNAKNMEANNLSLFLLKHCKIKNWGLRFLKVEFSKGHFNPSTILFFLQFPASRFFLFFIARQ